MKALSIRQPWAHLIIHHGKNIENRTWHTKFRGRFLVHASKGMTKAEYIAAIDVLVHVASADILKRLPMMEDLQRGGIVGSVELVDSLDSSPSPWYMGQKALVLQNPQELPFTPYRGQLGFYEVDAQALGLVVPHE